MCPQPFSGLSTYPNGTYTMCCPALPPRTEMEKQAIAEWVGNRSLPNINSTKPSDWFKDPLLKKIREEFKKDSSPILDVTCAVCKSQERNGIKSYRQFNLEAVDEVELSDLIENAEDPDYIHLMELNALGGNLCNLACNMCRGESSSKFRTEEIQLGEIESTRALVKPFISEETRNDIISILPKVREIKFTGGEPLMNDELFWVFDNTPKVNQKLRIASNFTKNVDKFLDATQDFEHVHIDMSIDGTYDEYEYIRYPGKWDVVEANVISAKGKTNYLLNTIFTLHALNVSSSIRVFEKAKEWDTEKSLNVVSNNFYSIRSVPPEIRQIHISRLTKKANEYPILNDIIALLNDWIYDETEMWNMLKHVKRRDILRKKNLLTVYPEWEMYYNSLEEY